jgi:ribosomal protein L11 methylase PrmA
MSNQPKIPFFPTTRYRVQTMIQLASIKKSEKAADLGSGDGRIVIALAQAGAQAQGYEQDENLIDISKELIRRARCDSRAVIHNKDFWQENLSTYDIICVYPMPDVMEALEKKLQEELKPGARVLLNFYPFPNWKAKKKKDNVYLYVKKSL